MEAKPHIRDPYTCDKVRERWWGIARGEATQMGGHIQRIRSLEERVKALEEENKKLKKKLDKPKPRVERKLEELGE